MNFESKLALAKKELVDKGVWKTPTGNRVYNTLQYLGIKFRPMYYFSFLRVFLPTSIFFGFAFGILMAVTSDEIDFSVRAISVTVVAAIAFGLCIATMSWSEAKKYNLSNWDSL